MTTGLIEIKSYQDHYFQSCPGINKYLPNWYYSIILYLMNLIKIVNSLSCSYTDSNLTLMQFLLITAG